MLLFRAPKEELDLNFLLRLSDSVTHVLLTFM